MLNKYSPLILLCCVGFVGCSDGPESPASGSSAENAAAIAAPKSTRPSGKVSDWKGDITAFHKIELCSVDAVNATSATDGAFVVSAAQPLAFDGWLATPDMRAPGEFSIVLSGSPAFAITATTGVMRDDVTKAYSAPALQYSGYHVEVAASQIPAGEYGISLIQTVNGEDVVCNSLQRLRVN